MPMGRPPKPAGQVKQVNLIVRLLPEERQELSRAVERDGETNLSTWVRKVLLAAARKR